MLHSCCKKGGKKVCWVTFWELPKSQKHQFIRQSLRSIINLFFSLLIIEVLSEISGKNVDRGRQRFGSWVGAGCWASGAG